MNISPNAIYGCNDYNTHRQSLLVGAFLAKNKSYNSFFVLYYTDSIDWTHFETISLVNSATVRYNEMATIQQQQCDSGQKSHAHTHTHTHHKLSCQVKCTRKSHSIRLVIELIKQKKSINRWMSKCFVIHVFLLSQRTNVDGKNDITTFCRYKCYGNELVHQEISIKCILLLRNR